MMLQTICATLSLTIIMLSTGIYKLSSVESVLAVGDKSKTFTIFWRTLVGFLSSSLYSSNKLLENRLERLEDHMVEYLKELEANTQASDKGVSNDTTVH